jgi:serine acetyltransferase
MADVGRDSIIGAGAVVTSPIPDRVVAAGVPARVIRARDARVATVLADASGRVATSGAAGTSDAGTPRSA